MTKKLLIVYNVLKIGMLALFMFWESQALWNNFEYRYQYLLLLYICLPILLILGVVETLLLRKIIEKYILISAFPFFTTTLIYSAICLFDSGLDQRQTSWNLIVVLAIGIVLAIVKSYKLMKLLES